MRRTITYVCGRCGNGDLEHSGTMRWNAVDSRFEGFEADGMEAYCNFCSDRVWDITVRTPVAANLYEITTEDAFPPYSKSIILKAAPPGRGEEFFILDEVSHDGVVHQHEAMYFSHVRALI